jgi:hypothetical protein
MDKGNKRYLYPVLFLCSLMGSLNVYAQGITVENASGRFKDSFYQVNANINYDLSESVLEALTHGITLRFDVSVEVKRVRNWIWDRKHATAILSFQLEYLPLNNNYLVINLVTGERIQLQELDEALRFLGTIENFPVISEDNLDPDRSYNCFIMSELRIRNLPLPLQPLARISPSWKLSSQWYEWTIR